MQKMLKTIHKNVLGTALMPCGTTPMTGFYRDGFCKTDAQDHGLHVVAAIMTKEFLDFSRAQGNDLQTPRPEYNFPGLKPGDKWCLCAMRWKEAEKAGIAPPVNLAATHIKALEVIPLDILQRHQVN